MSLQIVSPNVSSKCLIKKSHQMYHQNVSSYLVMLCHVMSCHILSCLIISHHVSSCLIFSHHVSLCPRYVPEMSPQAVRFSSMILYSVISLMPVLQAVFYGKKTTHENISCCTFALVKWLECNNPLFSS